MISFFKITYMAREMDRMGCHGRRIVIFCGAEANKPADSGISCSGCSSQEGAACSPVGLKRCHFSVLVAVEGVSDGEGNAVVITFRRNTFVEFKMVIVINNRVA